MHKIKRVLGQDDWLFYARTEDGKLVYYNSEMDYHWDETPNKHGIDLPYEDYRKYYGSIAWRIDCTQMHTYIVNHANELNWQECDNDPVSGEYLGWGPEKDDEFIAKSRRQYLCD